MAFLCGMTLIIVTFDNKNVFTAIGFIVLIIGWALFMSGAEDER